MFGRSITRKAAMVATSAIVGTALLGGAALAAFSPAPIDTFSIVPGLEAEAQASAAGAPNAEAPKPGAADRLKAVLDALVAKNVITQAQEDAILAAAKQDKTGEEFLRRVFVNLFDQSAAYLEMKPADLKAKLPGTSLAAIAGSTAGKSRLGLVTYLTTAVNGAIDKALADSKITKDQADKAKAAAPDHLAKFVDHAYPKREPKTVAPPRVQSFIGDAVGAARDYLGLSAQDVMTGLRSGKSLGEIATGTTGKSRTGLIATVTASTNTKIDKAQQDGKLTADQATKLKADVLNAVTQLVDHKGGASTAIGKLPAIPKPATR
jgi:hypothetical protein